MAVHSSDFPRRRPETSSDAFMKVGILLLGLLVGVLGLVAVLMWADARQSRDDGTTAAAASPAAEHNHAATDHNTALPLNSFAGVVPANAQALAEAHKPYDATMPPVAPGNAVKVHMTLKDMTVQIAPGVRYNTWAFDGHGAPGPIVHVRQGQTVEMTLTNGGSIPHSIDFHAARIAPNVAFKDVMPGQSFTFRFKANDPGVFMYHCGTKPVLAHIANGMYGAIVVEPKQALPKADKEYVLVASEWYLDGDGISKPASLNMAKARSMMPDWTTFNGYANQYVTHPLTSKPGQTVRFWVVAAGPDTGHELPRRRDDPQPRVGQRRHDAFPAQRPDGGCACRRRRGVRREGRQTGPVSVRLACVCARRPRPSGSPEGRQPQRHHVPLITARP